ncbi:MAG: hypothetical protein ACT4QC_09025 [Planctomycetaceae bacterium]
MTEKIELESSALAWRRDVRGKPMKKKGKSMPMNELRREYSPDLIRRGIRGRYAKRYAAGTNLVLLDPDVASAFPTPRSVNDALRLFVKIARGMQTAARRAKVVGDTKSR